MSMPKIKVLIADNSSFARLVMSDILKSDPVIEVVDTASCGDELFDKARRLKPDVIYLDAGMVRHDRFLSIRRIMNECTVPMVVSATSEKYDEKTINDAREAGVVDYIIKPQHILQPGLRSIGNEVIGKIKSAARIKPVPASPTRESSGTVRINRLEKRAYQAPTHLVVIGASTGGPQVLDQLVKNIRPGFTGAILIAQHMPGGFTRSFAERLNAISSLPVCEAENGMPVEAGRIIVAKGDTDNIITPLMGMKQKCAISFVEETSAYDRPSIDMLMESAAAAFGNKTMGIILSGMGSDGTMGAKAICKSGGLTMAQDEESCAIFGMGKAALEQGYIHKVLTVNQICDYINSSFVYSTL